jgi:hypothetical protein
VIHYEIVVLDPEQFTSNNQHGTDANVLFERRVAMVNTQSHHRSRKNGGLTQLLALEQSGGHTGALLSKNIGRAVKVCTPFFLTT